MLQVALTGGIGSGKSTVADYFSELGVPIIDMDVIAREITKPAGIAYGGIVSRYGQAILLNDGTIDRSFLRSKIFQDPEEREWLESLLHPLIREQTAIQLNEIDAVYVIIVIPLLVEAKKRFEGIDRVLVVDVDETVQLARVQQRDRQDQAAVQKVLDAQCSREARLAVADDVIHNHGDLADLKQQVAQWHNFYLDVSQ